MLENWSCNTEGHFYHLRVLFILFQHGKKLTRKWKMILLSYPIVARWSKQLTKASLKASRENNIWQSTDESRRNIS